MCHIAVLDVLVKRRFGLISISKNCLGKGMIRLEDIKAGALIQGLEPGEVVRIVTGEPIGPGSLLSCYIHCVNDKAGQKMPDPIMILSRHGSPSKSKLRIRA
jgi:hypothetical protein